MGGFLISVHITLNKLFILQKYPPKRSGTSNRINDRYALAVIGHEDQGFQGYSAF